MQTIEEIGYNTFIEELKKIGNGSENWDETKIKDYYNQNLKKRVDISLIRCRTLLRGISVSYQECTGYYVAGYDKFKFVENKDGKKLPDTTQLQGSKNIFWNSDENKLVGVDSWGTDQYEIGRKYKLFFKVDTQFGNTLRPNGAVPLDEKKELSVLESELKATMRLDEMQKFHPYILSVKLNETIKTNFNEPYFVDNQLMSTTNTGHELRMNGCNFSATGTTVDGQFVGMTFRPRIIGKLYYDNVLDKEDLEEIRIAEESEREKLLLGKLSNLTVNFVGVLTGITSRVSVMDGNTKFYRFDVCSIWYTDTFFPKKDVSVQSELVSDKPVVVSMSDKVLEIVTQTPQISEDTVAEKLGKEFNIDDVYKELDELFKKGKVIKNRINGAVCYTVV